MRTAVALAALTVLLGLAALSWGDQALSPRELLGALVGGDVDADRAFIVLDIRLPRSVLAFLVGVSLGVAGTIAQAVMRNPLAEPSLLGISSGAALAAMILLVGFGGSAVWLPWCSFIGAAAMSLVIWLLAGQGGGASMRIILVGIGLSALAGAATNFLAAFGELRDVQRAMVWTIGSVYEGSWAKVLTLLVWVALPVGLSWLAAHDLDLIGFGDGPARSLGQRVARTRALLILACTVISAAAVAAAGLIGFVGLIAPHLARRLVGPLHRRLLPVAAIVGGLLVLGADLLGRILIAPAQIPAGLMTALLGAPFFAFLMWERRHVRG